MQEAAERVSRDETYSSLEMNRVFFASLLSSNADSAAPLVGESRVVIATKADLDEFTDADHYANMCRGRVRVEEHIERQLHCRRYTNDGHPYLRLMPVNMEEMSLDPLLVVFHDVMLPNEIKIFKQLSRPQVCKTVQDIGSEKFQKCHEL
ncbi:unnamed protein product [Cyprideis torosa]|uniref:Uncharacterized protein n=1 Tax=Cyprideis torosa TaxID=163714 RepID=A0A7R8ZW78_9CRUS|nr:unnamed protein product [Cyprideis torosa]CAG0904737.1 unnamed protein product [Cyprideis torosa]